MTQSERSRDLARRNEEAIQAYRKADCTIYYLPAPDNDEWFEELMRKYEIPSMHEMELPAKGVGVLMVND